MSITTLSSANYVRVFDNATLARPVATGVNVISGWIKPAAAGAGTNRGYFALSDTTTGTPRVVDVSIGTNNQLHVRIRSGTGAYSVDADFGSMVAFWDTWVHIAVAIEGPHDGTAKAYRVLRNGVELNTGGATFTSAVDSTVWDTTFCGRSQVVSSANGADKIAYYNISNVADLATAMQLVADLQTQPRLALLSVTSLGPYSRRPPRPRAASTS